VELRPQLLSLLRQRPDEGTAIEETQARIGALAAVARQKLGVTV
jgi:hypothetical protein